ncbi:antibiotic biosynthesis monooxygenase family protein [Pseudomonas sp. SLFW]|uniref:antibiotic biosynthesis monooxygenase family protein n=1 Tax=Pseudomonas sp. SLFW TaxID=2683259 RepID=UPI0014134A0A|nr:antibiotic biosynthesis monooxygenase [Pseudomonas sp. SLFW]NBB09859.1 hypothetical protein [Pseudomonas sp. SLFW]
MRIAAINTVTVKTKPGQTAHVLSVLSEMTEQFHAQSGCLSYGAVESKSQPALLVVTGHWSCPDCMNGHFLNPALQTFSTLLESNIVYSLSFHHTVLEPNNKEPRSS